MSDPRFFLFFIVFNLIVMAACFRDYETKIATLKAKLEACECQKI
jgi:hypothetical protein